MAFAVVTLRLPTYAYISRHSMQGAMNLFTKKLPIRPYAAERTVIEDFDCFEIDSRVPMCLLRQCCRPQRRHGCRRQACRRGLRRWETRKVGIKWLNVSDHAA